MEHIHQKSPQVKVDTPINLTQASLPPQELTSTTSQRYISELMQDILGGGKEADRASIEFHEIAHNSDKDARSLLCRPYIFRELLELHKSVLSELKINQTPTPELIFLIANSEIGDLYPHDKVSLSEAHEWARVLNLHLCALGIVDNWKEHHSEQLMFINQMLEGILFIGEIPIQLPEERSSSIKNEIRNLLERAGSRFITDGDLDQHILAATGLVRLAGLFQISEARELLKDFYCTVHQRCEYLDSELYGPAVELDDESELEELDPDDQDLPFFPSKSDLDEEEPPFDDSDTVRVEYEKISDSRYDEESRYILDNSDPIGEMMKETLNLYGDLHEDILVSIRKIPSTRSDAHFWIGILEETTHYMPDWHRALDGLVCTSPVRVRQFLPYLLEIAMEDSLGVAHLLHLMGSKVHLHSDCSYDPAPEVIQSILHLSRREQMRIIDMGKELFIQDCVLIEDPRVRSLFEELAHKVHLPLSNRKGQF